MKNKRANYTSPEIQNEIINLLANQIRFNKMPKVSEFFALICDETMDMSRNEVVSICLRRVDDELHIHENFFGFFRTKIQTAAAIFELIKSVLENFKLDLKCLVAQSFDGAATMAGSKNGVAKKFSDLVEYAVFVHCYAHKLNLALVDATSKLKEVSDVLLIIQNVTVFIERSAKRHALFEHIQGEKKTTLQNFCSTRWASRYLAIRAFVNSYKYLLTFLEVFYIYHDL